MKNKRLVLCMMVFLAFTKCPAQTGNPTLDFILLHAEETSLDMQNARRNLIIAERNYSRWLENYRTGFSISAANTFSNIPESTMMAPYEAGLTTTVSQMLPGGISLSLTGSVTMEKQSLEAALPHDFSNLGYSDVVSASMSVSIPLWSSGTRENPLKSQLHLSLEARSLSYALAEEGVVRQCLGLYIQLRGNERNFSSAVRNLDIAQKILEVSIERYGKGQCTLSDIFSAEESLSSYRNQVKTCERTREELLMQVASLLNCPADDEFRSLFCAVDEELLVQSLAMNATDAQRSLLEIQRQQVSFQKSMARLSYAPVLTVSGSVEGVSEAYSFESPLSLFRSREGFLWAVTVGLDLSPIMDGRRKTEFLEYDFSEANAEEQLEAYDRALKETVRYYVRVLEDSLSQRVELNESLENRKSILQSAEQLFGAGRCTELELLQAETAYLNMEDSISNMDDSIWYLNWLLLNMRAK